MKKQRMKSFGNIDKLIDAWVQGAAPEGRCRTAFFVGDKMFYGRPDLCSPQVAQIIRGTPPTVLSTAWYCGNPKAAQRLANRVYYYTQQWVRNPDGSVLFTDENGVKRYQKRDIKHAFVPGFNVEQAHKLIRERITCLYIAARRSPANRSYSKEFYDKCLKEEPVHFDLFAQAMGSELRAFPEKAEDWNEADTYAMLMRTKGNSS